MEIAGILISALSVLTAGGWWWLVVVWVLLISWVVIGAVLTDPYARYTTVQAPFQTRVRRNGQLELVVVSVPEVRTGWWWRWTALARAGVRIVLSRWWGEPQLGDQPTTVVAAIHQRRFDPQKPYVITGAHYSDLYVRNLGVFFHDLLDQLSPDPIDLQRRQRLAVQTIALDLAYLRAAGRLVTTIVPLGGFAFTGVNIYEEPSDSLHAVLYTLLRLQSQPVTHAVAQQLLAEYRAELTAEAHRYFTLVIDPSCGSVRRQLHLASARDGVKRQAAFYDSVIAWRTIGLAQQLGLTKPVDWPVAYHWLADAAAWKAALQRQYWDESRGIYANDLSRPLPQAAFSADSLIVWQTGFLDPRRAADRRQLERMVAYIQDQELDQPFPLRYSPTNQQNRLHWAVQLAAPGYMGQGIWSHWGIEYSNVLLALAGTRSAHSSTYLQQARQHLDCYRQNMAKFGGYPELYAGDGRPFQTWALRAVLHTGWVVNYEAACQRAAGLIKTGR